MLIYQLHLRAKLKIVLELNLNRYKFPLLAFLLLLAIPFGISNPEPLNGYVLLVFFIIWVVISLFYFLLTATIGRFIKKDIIAISLCSGLTLLVSGFTFRVMHYPGGYAQVLCSNILILIAIILSIISIFRKK